jgi:hypothetical protein
MNPFSHLVGLLQRGISQLLAFYLHRTAEHNVEKCGQDFMHPSKIRNRDICFERYNVIRILERMATVIGYHFYCHIFASPQTRSQILGNHVAEHLNQFHQTRVGELKHCMCVRNANLKPRVTLYTVSTMDATA